jgi:ABC-type multidrug transport system ATPase subunit
MKNQATDGRTVIATIHQPSTDIFNLFDRLLLLSEGYVMYQGETQKATAFFGEVGFPLPALTNPADHYIEMLSTEIRNQPTEDEQKRLDTIKNGWDER